MSEPRRHLIVRAHPGLALTVQDDSLRIDQPHRATQWFPVSRLGALDIIGHTQVDTALLAHLAGAGVRLRLFPGAGEQAAGVIASTIRHVDLSAAIDAMQQHAVWRRNYAHWRVRQDLWGLGRALAGRLNLSTALRCMGPAAVARTLHKRKPERLVLLAGLGPILATEAARLAHEAGWPRDRLQNPRPGPHAQRDVIRAMYWDAIGLLHQPPASTDPYLWHPQHAAQLGCRGRLTLDALHRFALQSALPYP